MVVFVLSTPAVSQDAELYDCELEVHDEVLTAMVKDIQGELLGVGLSRLKMLADWR